MTLKLFCYVDETGQDTRGELFIVSVVVSAQEREELRRVCETVEQATGKNRLKWTESDPRRRLDYMRRVLERPIFQGKLNFAVYHDSRDYSALTIKTVTEALSQLGTTDYEATVLIDALPRTLERAVGLQLRRSGIRAKKVRG